MKTAIEALVCCLLMAATAALVQLAVAIQEVPVQMTGIRADAMGAIADTRAETLKVIVENCDKILARMDKLVNLTDIRSGQLVEIASRTETDARDQIVEIRGDINKQLTAANSTLAGTASGVNLLTGTYSALPDQIARNREFKSYVANGLGFIAAAKMTAGQTEKTMASIDRATPQLLLNFKDFTFASIDASKHTSTLMGNLAASTKPLPTWARIGFAVAPPVAGAAAAAATAWSILH